MRFAQSVDCRCRQNSADDLVRSHASGMSNFVWLSNVKVSESESRSRIVQERSRTSMIQVRSAFCARTRVRPLSNIAAALQWENAPLSVVYAAPCHFPTRMTPNGPPAKLVALNAIQTSAATDTPNTFVIAIPRGKTSE